MTTYSTVSGEITDVVGDHAGRGWCLMTLNRANKSTSSVFASEPTWENFDIICDQLFNSSSGKLATISKDAAFPLIDDISIPESTYTQRFLLIMYAPLICG